MTATTPTTTLTAASLLDASRDELRARAAHGRRVDPAALAGHLYHGLSLGLPPWVVRLTWRTFGKAFVADGGDVRGWNVRMIQDGLTWRPRPRDATFGHFLVDACAAEVVLDYGRGGNRRRDPIGRLRDPLVALDGARLLLGWTEVAAGPWRVPTPSWFVLERGPRVAVTIDPPRRLR